MNQEPKLKTEIPRKANQQTYSELYFPELRSTIFSILTGKKEIYSELKVNVEDELLKLSDAYEQLLVKMSDHTSIRFVFVENGIHLFGVKRAEKEADRLPDALYLRLDWNVDSILLTLIAKALNALILICTRKIPTLSSDTQRFKFVSNIETNPLYEYYAIIFAMYNKLNLGATLPRSYLQVLMSRKRVNYNSLVMAIKYVTTFPATVTDYFKGDIIKNQTYRYNRGTDSEGGQVIEEDTCVSLFLVDYTGQKFTQKLSFVVGQRQQFSNERFIEIDSDATTTV